LSTPSFAGLASIIPQSPARANTAGAPAWRRTGGPAAARSASSRSPSSAAHRPLARRRRRPPSEQPAQLVGRHRVEVVLGEVHLHQFGEGQRSRDPPLPLQPLEFALQRLRGVALGGKSAS
jgi:hypothetical protein